MISTPPAAGLRRTSRRRRRCRARSVPLMIRLAPLVVGLRRGDVVGQLPSREPALSHAVEPDDGGKVGAHREVGILDQVDASCLRSLHVIRAACELDVAPAREESTVSDFRVAEGRRDLRPGADPVLHLHEIRAATAFFDGLHCRRGFEVRRRIHVGEMLPDDSALDGFVQDCFEALNLALRERAVVERSSHRIDECSLVECHSPKTEIDGFVLRSCVRQTKSDAIS